MTHERIVCNPEIKCGKPVIRGTRITVELILRLLARRNTIESLIEAYPFLTAEDIYAAQAFAADYLASGRILAAE